MIVRNEAEAIAETLASVRDVADEILVLDTGSHDGTPAAARRCGAIVVEQPWDDSFSAARNACLQEASGDWVLWLDAGETLTNDDAQSLRTFVDEQADPTKAYMLLVKVPRAAGEIAGECRGCVRLVPHHPALRFTGRIGESLLPSLAENQIGLDALPQRICRGSREHDPVRKSERARRNLHLADLEIAEAGPMSHLLNCQGEALAALGERRRAVEAHRAALDNADPSSCDMLEAYYGLLTALEGGDASRQAQITVCIDALESFPLDAQLLCAMGGYLHSLGKNDLALRAYQTAWQHGQVNPAVWHLDHLSCIAANCYATMLELTGQEEEACSVLERSLVDRPDSPRLRRRLLDLHIKHGRRDDALAQLDHLPGDTAHREALRSAVRGACLAAQRNWIPARAYLDAAWQAGCRDVVCLRWLAVTLLALGEAEAARPVLAAWSEIDPHSREVKRYLAAISTTGAKPVAKQEGRLLRMDTGPTTKAAAAPNISRPATTDANDATSK
jgi:tetratricopeptide (TPR) repeat protein